VGNGGDNMRAREEGITSRTKVSKKELVDALSSAES
jgi:hypothetical protein